MSGKQQLIAFMGIFLIGLTIWQHWRDEFSTILFNSGPSKPDTPPYIPGPGVQPGSPYYPPNPHGGLPSKPPLGGTPPSGYS